MKLVAGSLGRAVCITIVYYLISMPFIKTFSSSIGIRIFDLILILIPSFVALALYEYAAQRLVWHKPALPAKKNKPKSAATKVM